jgi:hyperosmotically inducible protein
MKSSLIALGAVALLGFSLASFAENEPAHRSVGTTIDDATITTKIKADLVGDPVTKARQIHVRTRRGVVQLSGFVDSAASKERAGKIATDVEGVVKVHNNLLMRGEQRTAGTVIDDSVIKAKLKADLVADPTTKAHQIEVEVHQGVVALSGFVDSSAAKSRAEEIAHQVKGVRSVRNDLKVKQSLSRRDLGSSGSGDLLCSISQREVNRG